MARVVGGVWSHSRGYGWELTTVGALIAPTPFMFVSCDDDLGFPMAVNRRIAERLKKIYKTNRYRFVE